MKKSDLRKIVKEEIQKVISEMIEPSKFLKKKFPEVIEYDNKRKMSEIHWIVITTEPWKNDKASDFQEAVGYHPAGYGGPYEFQEETLSDGQFKYTWYCFASSN